MKKQLLFTLILFLIGSFEAKAQKNEKGLIIRSKLPIDLQI